MNHFIKEIDAPWIIEIITEKFDQSAINAMPELSLVYGGAIRDAIAGLPLISNLDMIVSNKQFRTIISIFNDSPKWTKCKEARVISKATKHLNIPKTVKRSMCTGRLSGYTIGKTNSISNPNIIHTPGATHELTISISPSMVGGPSVMGSHEIHDARSHEVCTTSPEKQPFVSELYKKAFPIEEILTYETQNGAKVQIIVIKPKQISITSDGFDALLDVVRNVDIICCGIAMDKNGNVFEIVEGAYEDCKNKVLRFNKTSIETIDMDNFERRIKKLEKRGWTSEINIKIVKKRWEKMDKIRKRREQRKKGDEKGERKEAVKSLTKSFGEETVFKDAMLKWNI